MKRLLGIELGSTRIKALITDEKGNTLAAGLYDWENIIVDGLWSYSEEMIMTGLKESYRKLTEDFKTKTGEEIHSFDAMGISAMMHGYLAFDENDKMLAPFRTWRNTNAAAASEELTEAFKFHMPIRWSSVQYYQSVLDGLPHVSKVAHLYTLSSYIHYLLTGRRVVGINDASGMFPVKGNDYDREKAEIYNGLLKKKGIVKNITDLLPEVLMAGEDAGVLTGEGALLLDPSGKLQPGIQMCPPEGDMGTGMVCTNCVRPGTANISSGTSCNLAVVTEKDFEDYYYETDNLAGPDGSPVVLVHTNNCTSETNQWVNLFDEVLKLFGLNVAKSELFEKLFVKSLEADDYTGRNVIFNYLAGEPLAGTREGAPAVIRSPEGCLNLANFMQASIYSSISVISLGMDILKKEGVRVRSVTAHGGLYKTDFVGQNATSAMLKAPVTVMVNAGEGGAWGASACWLFTGTTSVTATRLPCLISLTKFLKIQRKLRLKQGKRTKKSLTIT